MRIIPHYINGQEQLHPGKILDIYNPALGEKIAAIHCADAALIDQAVHSAEQAQNIWAKTPAVKRSKIFRNFLTLLEKNELELAEIISLEHGKTISDAKASIARGIEIVAYHCGIQQQLQGPYSKNVSQDVHTYTFYQPLGVCCGISPFNFPVMIPLWLLMPALACGNAMILKPSEKTPSVTLKLIQLFEEAGLNKGLAQCVQGDAKTVEDLLAHPRIQAFAAVGSSAAAKQIYSQAAIQGKRAQTFGGAKNHAIVMPDADFESASDAIISAAFGSAGQRCMALSAIICVGPKSQEKLLPLLIEKAKKIKIGPGSLADSDIGPLISSAQVERLKSACDLAKTQGATMVLDGSHWQHPDYPSGFFFAPCLISNVHPHMPIYQEELFGPILVILEASSIEQAIDIIQQHPYGNGAVIFTQNGRTADTFVDTVDAGMLGINISIPIPIVSHPFGGWKNSSFGANPMHGLDSVHFYTKAKTVTYTWPNTQENTGIDLDMPHNE